MTGNNTFENWKWFLDKIGIPYIITEDTDYDFETDKDIPDLYIQVGIKEGYFNDRISEEYKNTFRYARCQPALDVHFDPVTHKFCGFGTFGE